MTATQVEQKAERARTSYVVLKRIGAHNDTSEGTTSGTLKAVSWEVVKSLEATTARDAIRQTVGESSGTYVAVPARSMVPVTVKVEKQTVVKLT